MGQKKFGLDFCLSFCCITNVIFGTCQPPPHKKASVPRLKEVSDITDTKTRAGGDGGGQNISSKFLLHQIFVGKVGFKSKAQQGHIQSDYRMDRDESTRTTERREGEKWT